MIQAHKILHIDIAEFVQKHELANLQEDEWIPQQKQLSFMKDIHENGGNYYSLIALGRTVADTALLPPDITNIFEFFNIIDVAYRMNLRNGYAGEYKVETISQTHLRITVNTPYHSDMDYGLCWGFGKRFLPQGTFLKIVRQDAPSRLKGDDRCVYDLLW